MNHFRKYQGEESKLHICVWAHEQGNPHKPKFMFGRLYPVSFVCDFIWKQY